MTAVTANTAFYSMLRLRSPMCPFKFAACPKAALAPASREHEHESPFGVADALYSCLRKATPP